MNSHLYHLQLNIDFAGKDFYNELMTFLGWESIYEGEDLMGFKNSNTGDLWFAKTDEKETQNYDHRGVNHIGIRVTKQEDIDKCTEFLANAGITALFGTPKHRPEFTGSEEETYYQVMFESPDRILFEIVYIGAKG